MVVGKNKSYTDLIVQFVESTNYTDLPTNVIADAKRIILDTIGCGLGGYANDRGKIAVDMARDMGGKPEATIMVTGDKVSCTSAAFANGELFNTLDADETLLNITHFAAPVLAAALAVAERVGANGRDLITAFEMGFEVNARLLVSIRNFRIVGAPPHETIEPAESVGFGWWSVGAAVASGKLLNLNTDEMMSAMGLAGANAVSSVTRKMADENHWSMMKYTHDGFNSFIGIVSALLAQKGFIGKRDILDGDLGLWHFTGALEPMWNNLTEGLGEKWWILEDSIKPYPSCRYTHHPIDLIRRVVKDQRIRPEDIEGITVGINPMGFFVAQLGTPNIELDAKDPLTWFNTQFNLAYLLSVAALGYEPGPYWHNPAIYEDTRIRDLMKKVQIELNINAAPELVRAIREEPTGKWKKCPTYIRVKAGGKTFEDATDYAKGDPWSENTRMTDDQIKNKFRNFSNQILHSARVEQIIEKLIHLEEIDNIAELTDLLK